MKTAKLACHLCIIGWENPPYALCRSCRGMLDLQLSYSNLGALQFKFLEFQLVKQGYIELFRKNSTPLKPPARRRHATPRAPVVGPSGPGRWGTSATVGSSAPAPTPARPIPVATRHTPTGRAKPPCADHVTTPPIALPPYLAPRAPPCCAHVASWPGDLTCEPTSLAAYKKSKSSPAVRNAPTSRAAAVRH
jgi:hypothetical protein